MKWKASPLGWLCVLLVGGCGDKAQLVTPPPDSFDAGPEAAPPVVDAGPGIVFVNESGTGSDNVCDGMCSVDSGPPPVCGDGILNRSDEKCDDGNVVSGDGCTANCQQIEENFACPVPGMPCQSTVKCGDGRISVGIENCDDGNSVAGDGCDATCHKEEGWACKVVGVFCAPICGDGLLKGDEQCEFYASDAGAPVAADGGAEAGAPVGGNGCSATCQIEPGWDCNATTQTCAKTVCGNGTVELGEQCDDGANATVPFDGCLNCVSEPKCTAGACLAVCGDGKRYNTEECDDGNSRDGDGCSKDCKIEKGYRCTDSVPMASDKIVLPVIYRDFIGAVKGGDTGRAAFTAAQTAAGVKVHPDFNVFMGSGTAGVVAKALGADGRPVYVTPNNPGTGNFTGKDNYDKWYRNDPVYNRAVVGSITLASNGSFFVYDSDPFFGPLDGKGFNAAPVPPATTPPQLDTNAKSVAHNYSFTSETHFWFEYGGGEKFDFSGDDDVWVFVNGTLVVDLGGLHNKLTGSFILDSANGTASVTDLLGAHIVDLKLTLKSVYELVMFHAEREEVDSNFKITLKDFNKPKSTCAPVCGDGIVSRTEVCDDGKNDGSYNGCMPGCQKRGPYCGDMNVDEGHEKCDDGINMSAYNGCAPGCVLPACGDGIVQAGEQCDDGKLEGLYGGCATHCILAPHCGDGIVQADAGEFCDDGDRDSTNSCDNSCHFYTPN